MTIWNIHFLNARHALTPVRAELRAAVQQAVTQVCDHADLPDFDVVIRAQPGGGLTDWGVGGCAPSPGLIELTLDPARFVPLNVVRTMVHEMHHLIRWDGPGYGRSLGEALVSEGLAGHFVVQVMGGPPDPWDAVNPAPGLARRAMNDWAHRDYDHPQWFLGKGGIRRWTGYGLGWRIVAEHLTRLPDADAVTLATAKAEDFRAALRRIAGAEEAAENEVEKDAAKDPD